MVSGVAPTFNTPLLLTFGNTVLTGYPLFWLFLYIVPTGILYLVTYSSSSDWWLLAIRWMEAIGACILGWTLHMFVCLLWAGLRMFAYPSKKGKNEQSTWIAFLVVCSRVIIYLVHEIIVEFAIVPNYPTGRDAILSAANFGWEAGLFVLDTLILAGGMMAIIWSKESKIAYNYRGPYTWLYIFAISVIWPTYGLSFTRYITGWTTPDGEDWLPQLVNLGLVALWSSVYIIGGFMWREQKRPDSTRVIYNKDVDDDETGEYQKVEETSEE
jgi:hypothetical protein